MSAVRDTGIAAAIRMAVLGVVLGTLVFVVGACTPAVPEPVGTPGVDIAADPVEPAPWDLTTPESAVRSYLDWMSFSYRVIDPEIPVATMTSGEALRVEGFIQRNWMNGKGLEQSLGSIEFTPISEESTSAVIAAYEEWEYRYFAVDTLEYVSEPTSESYETTYTLVKDPGGWLVDSVEASVVGSR
ncbi:MAG: hypothetical protein RBS17_02660 [Coriobacteriia bacterium]|nr:hypothetical protein [Coriobacteriia bacterium]